MRRAPRRDPRRRDTQRTVRGVALVAMAFGAAVIVAFYFVFDPEQFAWMPRCVFHSLTGWDCPGCGSQRMAHALLHGDLSGAWHANAYLLVMLIPIAFMAWLELNRNRHPSLYRRVFAPWLLYTVTASLILWGIGRNLF